MVQVAAGQYEFKVWDAVFTNMLDLNVRAAHIGAATGLTPAHVGTKACLACTRRRIALAPQVDLILVRDLIFHLPKWEVLLSPPPMRTRTHTHAHACAHTHTKRTREGGTLTRAASASPRAQPHRRIEPT